MESEDDSEEQVPKLCDFITMLISGVVLFFFIWLMILGVIFIGGWVLLPE